MFGKLFIHSIIKPPLNQILLSQKIKKTINFSVLFLMTLTQHPSNANNNLLTTPITFSPLPSIVQSPTSTPPSTITTPPSSNTTTQPTVPLSVSNGNTGSATNSLPLTPSGSTQPDNHTSGSVNSLQKNSEINQQGKFDNSHNLNYHYISSNEKMSNHGFAPVIRSSPSIANHQSTVKSNLPNNTADSSSFNVLTTSNATVSKAKSSIPNQFQKFNQRQVGQKLPLTGFVHPNANNNAITSTNTNHTSTQPTETNQTHQITRGTKSSVKHFPTHQSQSQGFSYQNQHQKNNRSQKDTHFNIPSKNTGSHNSQNWQQQQHRYSGQYNNRGDYYDNDDHRNGNQGEEERIHGHERGQQAGRIYGYRSSGRSSHIRSDEEEEYHHPSRFNQEENHDSKGQYHHSSRTSREDNYGREEQDHHPRLSQHKSRHYERDYQEEDQNAIRQSRIHHNNRD